MLIPLYLPLVFSYLSTVTLHIPLYDHYHFLQHSTNCTNDWISMPEVLQTVLVLQGIKLKVSRRWRRYGRAFEISLLVYIYKTPCHYPEKRSTIPVYYCQLLMMPPSSSKMSTVHHMFQSWLISLISSLIIIAQKVKLFGMYHSYWESSCNRHVGWKFFFALLGKASRC
jgi:hypothetical protein